MKIENKIVWMDIPVENLERAAKFYSKVMKLEFSVEMHGDMKFAMCPHSDNEAAFCLVVDPSFKEKSLNHIYPLVYLNVNGRMKTALEQVKNFGGKIIEPKTEIGPYGFRAIIVL
ncbi:MAG: VOC family protein [Pseudomonadota bacterium]